MTVAPGISVVIPCYRSSGSLPPLLERLHTELPKLGRLYEVILVVDGSPDDTFAVAHRLREERPDVVRTVLLRRNYGQHNALLAGVVRARFDITVTMDDDLQHRPDQIGRLLEPLSDPMVDLVYGVAESEEHGFVRSFASRTVKAGLAAAGVQHARDVSAFRAFRTELRDVVRAEDLDPFVSMDVVLSWATNSVRRAPVRMDRREIGTSSYTLRALVRHAWNMVAGYSTLPLRIVTWLGVVLSIVGAATLLTVLIGKLTGVITVAGFTSLMAVQALFSGTVMLSLGIIGEYLGRLHFRSMRQPAFLVRTDSGEAGSLPVEEAIVELHPDALVADEVRTGAGG